MAEPLRVDPPRADRVSWMMVTVLVALVLRRRMVPNKEEALALVLRLLRQLQARN